MSATAFQLSIPKPCHEDWHSMTPEEKGRHCASCQMVVRDFTQMSQAEALHTFKQEGTHCGRFRHDQLHSIGGGGTVGYRFPLQRLRTFLLCFLATFGFASFAFASETLVELQPIEKALQAQPLEALGAQPVTDTTRIMGRVLDKHSAEPLEHARVTAEWGGKVISSATTDTAGVFRLKIPTKYRKGLTLTFSYGQTLLRQDNIPSDVTELAVLLESGLEMDPVVIEGRPGRDEFYQLQGETIASSPMGVVSGHGPSCGHEMLDKHGPYYHELHEWIFMRNSEVFTKDY